MLDCGQLARPSTTSRSGRHPQAPLPVKQPCLWGALNLWGRSIGRPVVASSPWMPGCWFGSQI